jgi:hypothetical protein
LEGGRYVLALLGLEEAMLRDFKDFLFRGNLIELAVA